MHEVGVGCDRRHLEFDVHAERLRRARADFPFHHRRLSDQDTAVEDQGRPALELEAGVVGILDGDGHNQRNVQHEVGEGLELDLPEADHRAAHFRLLRLEDR